MHLAQAYRAVIRSSRRQEILCYAAHSLGSTIGMHNILVALYLKPGVLVLVAFLYSFVFVCVLLQQSANDLGKEQVRLIPLNYNASGYPQEVSSTEHRSIFAVLRVSPSHESNATDLEQPKLRSTALPSDPPTPLQDTTERSLFGKISDIVDMNLFISDRALFRKFPQAKYLSSKANQQLRYCTLEALAPDFYNLSRMVNQEDGDQCTKLEDMHFTGADGLSSMWPRTALASFPGSGNTWLRTLLEQLTGIFTGSEDRCDRVLRASGHLGEGITTNDVLAIKTHFAKDNGYGKAIVLVRDPFDAILAEYHRSTLWSHVGKLEPAHFGKTYIMIEFKHACTGRHTHVHMHTSCHVMRIIN